MGLADKIRQAELAPKLYTVRGDLSFDPDGRVRITFTKDAYALVSENHIHPEFLLPLDRDEDPSGRRSKFALKLIENAVVELHVESLMHTFKLAQGERPFLIDAAELKVIFFEPAETKGCDYECRKHVTIADIYCCGGGFLEGGFGLVGCSDEWCDEEQCCP